MVHLLPTRRQRSALRPFWPRKFTYDLGLLEPGFVDARALAAGTSPNAGLM